jgi:arsenite-transporting ATPase
MRTIIYTGKGGVGKTSLSAATAIASAKRGHKTLVMSTDSAHSLGDSLGVTLGPDPVEISKNLFALEVDVLVEMERHWKEVYSYITDLLRSQGMEEITAKEIVILPGMDLIAALLLLENYAHTKAYDVVVMDTAPTADTLRLLSMPDVLRWYFDHFFKMQRRLVRVARPTVGKVMKTPLPTDSFFSAIQLLYDRAQKVREMLSDGKQTTVRLVVNPQKMVISETQRAFTYLCLFDIPIELLVVNKVLPSQDDGAYLAEAVEEEKKNLETIKETFGEVPILYSPRYPREVLGEERLLQLASDVFGKNDAAKIFAALRPIRFFTRGEVKKLSIELPYVENEKIEVVTRGDTLYVRVGWHRRTILLPYAYVGTQLGEAKYSGGRLVVDFK